MTKTKKRGSRWRIATLILAACAVLGAFGAAQQRSGSAREFSLADTASYSGTAYVVVNGNEPYFTEDDYTTEAF